MEAEFITTLNYSTIETSGFSIWPNTRIMKTHLSMGLEIDGYTENKAKMNIQQAIKNEIAGCCISDASANEAVKRVLIALIGFPPMQEQFNRITDLRPFLLYHPDGEMVEVSCLHYLGDEAQAWWGGKPTASPPKTPSPDATPAPLVDNPGDSTTA